MQRISCALRKVVLSSRQLSPSFSTSIQNGISSVKVHQTNESLHFQLCSNNIDSSSLNSRPYILTPSMPSVREINELEISEGLIDAIASSIEEHYAIENSEQFVGGMGENDGGVWISSDTSVDTLYYWEDIRDIIEHVKQNRHGIPFGVFTSGITEDMEIASNLKGIGLSTIQVSLISSNPESYAAIRGIKDLAKAQSDFGQVCNFIATAAESGFPVIAAVVGKHGGAELAKALGAVDVAVYDGIGTSS
mmetsp:Transcript_665/g.1049  ORF Transcript_665/g.1049 Transcript_665/m.1049 type:complete len:249 (+) Transcript_665:117-863(+)